MVTKKFTGFESMAEVRAFAAGVDWVNDGGVNVRGYELEGNRYSLVVDDEDGETEGQEISYSPDRLESI